MRRVLVLLSFISSVLGLSMAQQVAAFPIYHPQAPSPDTPVTFVRFAHTSIDVGILDIYAGTGSTSPIIENFSYNDVSDFFAISALDSRLTVRYAGTPADSEPLFVLDYDFGANGSWLVLASGLARKQAFSLHPISIPRNSATYPDERGFVRVISAVNEGTGLAVFGENLNLGRGMGWLAVRDNRVDEGEYALQVGDASGAILSEQSTSITVTPYSTTMVVITGDTDGAPPYHLLSLTVPREQARLSVLNERAETLDILIRPSDGTLIPLATGEQSPFLAISVTDAAIYVFPEGGSGRVAGLTYNQRLRAGRDTTLVLEADGGIRVEEAFTP